MSISIGRHTPEEMGKSRREHIQIHNDTREFVSRNHGDISVEKGRIFYTDHSTNGTTMTDASGNVLREIKNEKVEITDPSMRLVFPNGSTISFRIETVKLEVSKPEQVKKQPVEGVNKLDRMLEGAGNRSAEQVISFIDNISKRLGDENKAGKVGMGIDNKGNSFKGGMWVEGSLAHLPREGKAILVGDIHSRLNCLEHILKETDFVERVGRGEKIYMVFMGDFADRPRAEGDLGGIKVLETVLSLKNQFWNNVVILSGNHDVATEGSINPQQFPQEARMKYGNEKGNIIFEKYKQLFNQVPIAVKMDNGGFVTHGGAASTVRSLSDVINPSEETKMQMRWNDPREKAKGYGVSTRGEGIYQYGVQEHYSFLKAVDSTMMFRAHEQEIRSDFNDTCITINSTDYKNAPKAYAVVDLSRELTKYQIYDVSDVISGKVDTSPSIMLFTF